MIDSSSDFVIRRADRKDRVRWEAMFLDLAGTGPEPCAKDAPDFVWQCALESDGQMELFIVADKNDDAIGFMLYVTHSYSWSRRAVAYLLELYVEPASRGAGIGTALVNRLAAIGREAGWLRISWMTQADNVAAHSLYGKLATRSSLVRYDLRLNDYELPAGSA